ncbi:hypothetical protein [Nocardioides sp. B-3]|uniref:hypothetical protein n=1 Tax=Nocardioides sp. B-3 TaxID=2895565 RepID=UPI0021534630|nr:hypothetical protein [Nocardioides sp. B-3]UUZ60707.1 hypothetical protein LP418_07840 [Nocardioides sp. B-3]
MSTFTSPYMFTCPTGFGTPIPASLDTALHIGDFISLSSIANWVVEKISGTDLLGEWGEWWAGDFTQCVAVAQAPDELAEFCTRSGEQIEARWHDLDKSWDGDAAADARHYFKGPARAIRAQQANPDEMSTEYQTAAFGVYEGAKAAGDLVATLIDYVIAAGVGALVTFFTGGVGSLFAGAGTAAAVLRIADPVVEIIEIRGKVLVGIEAGLAIIATGTSALTQFEDYALPGGYQHKGA